jgi:hypothetical protein
MMEAQRRNIPDDSHHHAISFSLSLILLENMNEEKGLLRNSFPVLYNVNIFSWVCGSLFEQSSKAAIYIIYHGVPCNV